MKRRILTQAYCDRLRRLCEVHTMTAVADITGTSRHTIATVKRRGWKAATFPRRPRPSTFALNAGEMTIYQLARHYRTGEATVRRWADEIVRPNLKPKNTRPARAIPDDLASIVERLGPYGAAAHYGVSYGTVRRWRKATGMSFSWSRQPGARRGVTPKPAMIGWADRYFTTTSTKGDHHV